MKKNNINNITSFDVIKNYKEIIEDFENNLKISLELIEEFKNRIKKY